MEVLQEEVLQEEGLALELQEREGMRRNETARNETAQNKTKHLPAREVGAAGAGESKEKGELTTISGWSEGLDGGDDRSTTAGCITSSRSTESAEQKRRECECVRREDVQNKSERSARREGVQNKPERSARREGVQSKPEGSARREGMQSKRDERRCRDRSKARPGGRTRTCVVVRVVGLGGALAARVVALD